MNRNNKFDIELTVKQMTDLVSAIDILEQDLLDENMSNRSVETLRRLKPVREQLQKKITLVERLLDPLKPFRNKRGKLR